MVNSTGTKQTKREAWIDWAKTITLYLMVVGHTWRPEVVSIPIYAFHMPMFLIISGYLYKRTNVLYSIISLVIPVIFVSFLNIIWDILCFGVDFEFIKAHFYHWQYRFIGIWFVETIILFRVIMSIPLVDKYYRQIGLFSFGFISLLDYFGLQVEPFFSEAMILECLPFLTLGLYLKREEVNLNLRKKRVVLMAFLFLFLSYALSGNDMRTATFSHGYFLFSVNSLLGCWVLYNICLKFQRKEWVEIISIGSIFVLGFHYSLFRLLQERLTPGKICDYVWLPYSVIIMITCYFIISLLITHTPWLLGRNIKKKI